MEYATEVRGTYMRDVEHRVLDVSVSSEMKRIMRANDPSREYALKKELEQRFSSLPSAEREKRIELIIKMEMEKVQEGQF